MQSLPNSNKKDSSSTTFSSRESSAGFTIIELLIVIGITAILAAGAAPIYSGLQVSTQLNESSAQISQDLRLAREQSHAGLNGVAHGVKFGTSQYTVFQGPSYATRTSGYDRVNTFSGALSISTTFAGNEILFAAGTGTPSADGTVTVVHEVSGTRLITVTSSGAVTD